MAPIQKNIYLQIRKETDLSIKNGTYYKLILQDLLILSIVGIIWSVTFFSLLKSLTPFLLATVVFRHFSMMHEASHGLLNTHKSLNTLFGTMSGIFCLLPFEPWRQSHLQHHYWSGNIEKDPVMAFLIRYPKMPTRQQKILSLIWKSWFPILGIIQNIVFWSLAIQMIKKNPRSPLLVGSLSLPLICWTAIFLMTSTEFIIFALAPALLIYFVAVEVVNLPHHLQTPYYRDEIKKPAWEQEKTARSCIYPKWFAQNFVLNFNYHIEHHLYPDAPWSCLPELHQKIIQNLNSEYNTDPQFAWILKNKKLPIDQVLFGNEANQKDHEVAS